MGIVHNHTERLADADVFESSRNLAQLFNAASDGSSRYAQSDSYPDRRANIKEVGLTHQGRAHLELADWRFEHSIGGFPPKLVAYRTDVRSNLHSIANDSRWIDRAQILITCIVGVQHHDARPRSGQALEKFSLCTKIRFHVSVKIQMIPAEISECRNIEVKSCDPFHFDCMRRNFHDCVKATGINHLSEQLLQIRCFRCGPFGHEMESWTTVFNGSENRRRFACSVQDRVHNVSCRCL